MPSVILLSATAVLLGAAACSNNSQPGDKIPVQGVKLTPQSVQLAVGETKRLNATVAPANATDKAMAWESTNPLVVSVDSTGLITANGAGAGIFITVITHDGGYQASANVGAGP